MISPLEGGCRTAQNAGVGPIRCYLVDDDHFVRQGLANGIRAMDGVDLVGAAASLEEAINSATPIDVLLLDLGLGDGCRRTATPRFLAARPASRVFVITAHASGPDVVQAFAEGAAGYVTKNVRPAELAEALQRVAVGETYVTPSLAGHLLNAGFTLTEGEHAVLRVVAQGAADKEVATILGISRGAVEKRIAAIRTKAGLVHQSRAP